MSKLWLARNGWLGNGSVSCIVEAENKNLATIAAQDCFKANWLNSESEGQDYFIVREIEEITLPFFAEID